MRPLRTLPLLVGLTAVLFAAGSALACGNAGAKVTGSFDSAGRFVLSGAWDKDGAAVANAAGTVLESFTTAENLVIPASNLAGKQVCLWGELDANAKTMHVAGYKECGAGACATKSASAAKSGCGAKAAEAKAASAGSSCGSHASDAKAAKLTEAQLATDANAAMLVYDVSGMTCGGCASKVQSAVTKLALPNVSGCTVDLERAQAVVTTTGEVDSEAIQKAITAAGFPAVPATTTADAAKS